MDRVLSESRRCQVGLSRSNRCFQTQNMYITSYRYCQMDFIICAVHRWWHKRTLLSWLFSTWCGWINCCQIFPDSECPWCIRHSEKSCPWKMQVISLEVWFALGYHKTRNKSMQITSSRTSQWFLLHHTYIPPELLVKYTSYILHVIFYWEYDTCGMVPGTMLECLLIVSKSTFQIKIVQNIDCRVYIE